MCETDKRYEFLQIRIAAQDIEIANLKKTLDQRCEGTSRRVDQLETHEGRLDDLAADLHQVERDLQYIISPRIDKITELLKQFQTTVRAWINRDTKKPASPENQP